MGKKPLYSWTRSNSGSLRPFIIHAVLGGNSPEHHDFGSLNDLGWGFTREAEPIITLMMTINDVN
jgi:hypothetical protein